MVLFCIISEIERDIGRKSPFFTHQHSFGDPRRNIAIRFGSLVRTTGMVGLPDGEKKFENVFTRFDKIHERDGQTDGQADTAHMHSITWQLCLTL